MNQKRSGKRRTKRPEGRAPSVRAAESFESVARAAPVCIFRADAAGRCIYINERWVEMTGRSCEEALGEGWARAVHPQDQERLRREWSEAVRQQQPLRWEFRFQKPEGAANWFLGDARPEFNEAGELAGFIGTVTNIDDLKGAELARLESEARLRLLIEQVPAILWTTDTELRFTSSVGAGLARLNLRPNQVAGRSLFDFFQTRDLDFGPIALQRRALRGESLSYEAEWMGRAFQVYVEPFRDAAGQIKGSLGVALDLTERKQTEEERDRLLAEARAAHDRLQILSRRLVEVQEAERRRLARELHDEVGQELTALKLYLDRSAAAAGDAAQPSLHEAQARANQLLTLVRELSLDLRPTMLDDLGLLPALLWQFDRYRAVTRVQVEFKHAGLEGRRFPAEIETAAYRIVQEALTNVVRHSGATEARVRLWAGEDTLSVQVEDHGRGFDPEAALRSGASSGLSGMRERATLLGGHLDLESAPGAGTHLTAELPLDGKTVER